MARAQREGLRLTPRQLFEQPTVAELALVAEQASGEETGDGGGVGAVPLTPIAHWFFEPSRWRRTTSTSRCCWV